jgi:RHS repeat-associated protein
LLTYDTANRLTSVTSDTLTTTFEYDGLGSRVVQTVDGVETRYALDVAGGLPEVIVATTGATSPRYVQVQGQILAQVGAGAWGYVAPDALGSVRQLVDPDGLVTLAQSYDPFGVLLEAAGPGASGFGYTGEQVDAGTGLVFLRARYYEPGVGRFLSEDPKPGIAYLPKTLHIYAYAWNNPVVFVDPSGLQPPPPQCDDPTQICYTGTTGPQVAHTPQETMPPLTASEPSDGVRLGGDLLPRLVEACYTLYTSAELEACLAKAYQLPRQERLLGPVCTPEPPPILTAGWEMEGDPVGSGGMGERKYSYVKTYAKRIAAFFLGGPSGGLGKPIEDLPALVGGTYYSELTAEVTIYEHGILTELRERYDATNLHGLGVGVDISVGRTVQIMLTVPDIFYGPYLFTPVSAGEQGVTEEKEVWMSASRRNIPSKALMQGAVSAENSFPLWVPGLGGGGYGWSYSLDLHP